MNDRNTSDRDYISSLFDADGIMAPDDLSEDSIMAMLSDDAGTAAQAADIEAATAGKNTDRLIVEFPDSSEDIIVTGSRPRERRRLSPAARKRIMAVAACLVIAAVSIPVVNAMITAPPDTSAVNGELMTFDSYNQIEKLVKSMDKSDNGGVVRNLLNLGRSDEAVEYINEDADAFGEAETFDAGAPSGLAAEEAAGGSASESKALTDQAGGAADSSHSSTYLQVEEVDEADIVKTDGKYIYYVTNREEVVILSADKGKTKQLAKIGSSGVENYIHDIFLKGDTLVTIGRTYSGDTGSTAVVTYDISDRSDPKLIGEFRQSGDIVSSRMVGSFVYLVTTDYVYNGGRIIPKCTIDGEFTDIPADEIRCMPEPQRTSYVILSSVDIASGKTVNARTSAVFGATDTIYCNDHNLYTASAEFDKKTGDMVTRIARASIDGLKIKFDATATVRGTINDQFSMDEHNGFFRIATTSQRDGMNVNNLFVLDDKLDVTGEISGFARNESIKSVRFMGDTAYVITYQAIDPLFVIDLSDASDPKIRGEVKIDGFSSLLVPIGRDKVLGIGYATGDNGYGGEYAAGLKLALFDTSDPAEPKVIDSKEFENMDSPAQNTHLALTVNREKGYYAIPYGIDHYQEIIVDEPDDILIDDAEEYEEDDVSEGGYYDYENRYEGGVLVFSAGADGSKGDKGGRIKVMDQHKLGSDYLTRCVYIGDYIYALDQEGETFSFKIK